jgi:DNA-binding beta-propeller fold protein YncE
VAATQIDPPTFVTKWGSAGTAAGEFRDPVGVAVTSSSNVLVVDAGNARVERFANDGTFLASYGSLGEAHGQLTEPFYVACDASESAYITDYAVASEGAGRVAKFDAGGQFVLDWVLPLGRAAQGVAVSPDGAFVYVTSATSILKYTASGAFLTEWSYWTHNGSENRGIVVGPSGTVYVAAYGDDIILEYSPDGTLLGHVGESGAGDGQLERPVGLATDREERLYVTDAGNGRCEIFDKTGAFLTKWGSVGSGDGQFIGALGIAVDGSGGIYVTDAVDRVQKFSFVPAAARTTTLGQLKRRFR